MPSVGCFLPINLARTPAARPRVGAFADAKLAVNLAPERLRAPGQRPIPQAEFPRAPQGVSFCGHSDRDRIAHVTGPSFEVHTMQGEKRERQAINAKRDAGRVRNFARFSSQLPDNSKMIAVIVEAHAGCR